MRNILEWLEADAARVPDKVAFADVDGQVTYGQLLARSRAIGSQVALRAPARQPVALYMEKSVDAICAMLGAVQAGCCYSFVDPRQPAGRIAKMADTLRPAFVLADASMVGQAREAFPASVPVVGLEELEAAGEETDVLALRREGALSTDPLYINFTSGSTGDPKGVVVGHSSVIDFIPEFARALGLSTDDVFACQAPLDFDVSVKDVYGALCLGATVHLIPREYFSEPVRLLDYLCEREPTVLVWAVSAMCFVSIMGGFDYKVPESVRLVAFSGEVMPPKQLAIWRSALPDARFFNVYGPTEITCNCTYYAIERDFGADEVIPMGRAFSNERVFLVAEDGSEVSEPGVSGELYVGGSTLAIGYYRDAARTAEAFVQNPLHDDYYDRVYKTGDVARYDGDGNLVYLSRIDHQIKHMGQRIELGEIDAAAQAVDGVSRACCIYDSERKRIRLFYTGSIGKVELKAAMREVLPPFMMPNNVKQVQDMPLTKNGKIDRAALERA